MHDKEMKKLRRAELLELLIQISQENEVLTAENKDLQERLDNRALGIHKAGSIAEAALQVNGIFEDAQRAADQYLENVRRIHDSAQAQADDLVARTQKKCDSMLDEAKTKSDAMLADARLGVEAQWTALQAKLDSYLALRKDLQEQLGTLYTPTSPPPLSAKPEEA